MQLALLNLVIFYASVSSPREIIVGVYDHKQCMGVHVCPIPSCGGVEAGHGGRLGMKCVGRGP